VSESAPPTDTCPSCGAAAPAGARFCPACGASVDGSWPGEPGPRAQAPISYEQAEPRWFGIAPPHLLLTLAGLVLVLALVLFATGHWPYGLILLGVGALLLAAFLEAARRRPGRVPVVRASSGARERAQTVLETWRARSAAAGELRRIRQGLARLEDERRGRLTDLGAAVHRGDADAEAAARARLAELDRDEAGLHARLDEALVEAGERIRKARLPVEETMMVIPPEPAPPPDEATPPQPPVVPEPYPPPDEADPPEPVRVPEPAPGGPARDPGEG